MEFPTSNQSFLEDQKNFSHGCLFQFIVTYLPHIFNLIMPRDFPLDIMIFGLTRRLWTLLHRSFPQFPFHICCCICLSFCHSIEEFICGLCLCFGIFLWISINFALHVSWRKSLHFTHPVEEIILGIDKLWMKLTYYEYRLMFWNDCEFWKGTC